MKMKLFTRVALEGNEELVEDGLDTDAVIDEETPPTEEEPTTVGGVKEDVEVDPADAEIEYPDVGNLEVDKVNEVLAEEEETRQAQVADALAATSQLSAAVEAMRVVIAAEGRLNPVMASNASGVLEYHRQHLGFRDTRPKFAMENYCGFNQKQSVLALEESVGTIRQIWNAIITAIKNALAWLKKAFISFFVGTERNLKNTTALTDAILKLRKDSRYVNIMGKAAEGKNGATAPSALIDKDHYVSLDGHKRFLSFNGKLPISGAGLESGSYTVPLFDEHGMATGNSVTPSFTHAFTNLLELVQVHNQFPLALTDKVIGQFEEVAECIEKGTALPNVPIGFNAMQLVKPGWFLANKSNTLDSVPGAGFVVNGFFLGSFQVYNRIRMAANLNVTDSLINIGTWGCAVEQSSIVSSDGWMRYLDTAELVSASAQVVNIGHELLAYEKTVDKMQAMHERFKDLAVQAAAVSSKLPADFFDKTNANGWRGETVNHLMRALNSVVSNVNTSLFQYASHAGSTCGAWNAYLREILKKETQMVQAVQ